uniref:Uncharacterized protein n=1 Tax=Arundo donax TaxID=35708 RepID=A0A0A9H834_ARUDO
MQNFPCDYCITLSFSMLTCCPFKFCSAKNKAHAKCFQQREE